MPDGGSGVWLKSNAPFSWASADSLGLRREGNAGGVILGTLGEGTGQYVWSTPAGEGCGAFGVGAVGGLAVTLVKMRESVWKAAN